MKSNYRTEAANGSIGIRAPSTVPGSVVEGADCIWDTLTPQEQEKVKTGLLVPATDVIRQHKMGIRVRVGAETHLLIANPSARPVLVQPHQVDSGIAWLTQGRDGLLRVSHLVP